MQALSATARHIRMIRDGAAQVAVLDDNTGIRIGTAEKVHGFIVYTGAKYTAHEGMRAVIRGTDSTYAALEQALTEGLRNGRDDRR